MSTSGLIKIALGIVLLLAFIPSGYLGIDGTLQTVLVILLAILGIKLILDGINEI